MSADLVAFLREQIAEDETWARDTLARFIHQHGPGAILDEVDVGLSSTVNVARRVMSEAAAKRAILDEWQAVLDSTDGSNEALAGAENALWAVMTHLAEVYRERPGYEPNWPR